MLGLDGLAFFFGWNVVSEEAAALVGVEAVVAGPLWGRDSMYIVTRGSCMSFSIAPSSGRAPVWSGLTVESSLAKIVHMALSAATNCCNPTLLKPGGGSVAYAANIAASHF